MARWLEDYWPQLTGAFATIAFAYVGVSLSLNPQEERPVWFITSTPGVVFLVATVLTLLGTIVGARRTRALRPLRERVAELENTLRRVRGDYYDQFAVELKIILNDTLGYGDTERISVYRHRGKGLSR